MLRIGGTKYVEQFWDHQGLCAAPARRPPRGATRATSPGSAPRLASRSGILEPYNKAINRGAAGMPR